MVSSKQHSRFSPEVNPKVAAKIANNYLNTISFKEYLELITL